MTQDLTRLGEINALLGRGTEYEGKLCFEGRVRIDGKFRGEIHSEDLLILGDGADVDGDLHVGKLIVRGGTLRGRVFAAQLVELFPPARVYADIRTPLFFVDRGVVFEGRCTMDERTVDPTPMESETPSRPSTDPNAAARDSGEVESGEGGDEGATEGAESASGEGAEGAKPKKKRTRRKA